jgi:hypothetical protein
LVEHEAPLVDEALGSRTGERLAYRCNLEQRIGVDRLLGVTDVRDAVSTHVRAAAPDDAHGGTGDGVALHPLHYLLIQGREQGVTIITPFRRDRRTR